MHAEDEIGEFSYDERSGRGPSRWGDLRANWFLCKNGTMQSPIALRDLKAQLTLEGLQTNYQPSAATLVNVELEWVGGGGTLLINGTQFVLQQCHWHSPSEHTISGKRFPLEIHMVHSAAGKIAVIGMLYWFGKSPDPFLEMFTNSIRNISRRPGAKRDVGIVDPNQININGGEYYRYMGSLTTPPCNESVIWTVIRKGPTVTLEQVQLLRDAVYDKSNARPLQPLNSRTVQLYVPREN
ncbi:hypothetical protein L6164_021996 [Bauhinia variegata]|uniref:Uncharacterized protein n=1 Tax=Bauhinia variegata TaxID=167791 RepID=A0ACB9MDT2_BAUVA|nr:hypothetical protein L6164_021996 [Bauhinia variegata]